MNRSSTTPFLRIVPAHLPARGLGVRVASPGEWAVTGAFRFAHRDPASLMGRERTIFRSSWLGLASFAPASHVAVEAIDADCLESLARRLAAYLLELGGLASPEAAVAAAVEEVEFARSLAGHAMGTVLVLEREFNEQGLVERARPVAPFLREP